MGASEYGGKMMIYVDVSMDQFFQHLITGYKPGAVETIIIRSSIVELLYASQEPSRQSATT